MADNPQPTNGDIALACMSLFVDELVRGGVSHLCVSPGSRSAPLVLAAARHPGIELHVHLDERSAAYVALGIGRASGRPAAVVCTSGTAVANWLPAVVEASAARVPMLLLSADRPPELHHTGANQAVDQVKVFGDAVRLFVDAGVPTADANAARYWRSLGSRAVAHALASAPGPVHVNIPFREPLLPVGGDVALGADREGRDDGGPWEVVSARTELPSHAVVERLADVIASSPRGVVIAGGAAGTPSSAVARLAAAAGWPLIADPLSGLRTPGALSAGAALLGDAPFVQAHTPDVVLQCGAAPISSAALALAARVTTLIVVDPAGLWPDPRRAARWTLHCDAEALATAVAAHIPPRVDAAWLEEWHRADAQARRAIDVALDADDTPSEPRTARDLAAALPGGATLVVASSMPVRDLDAFMAPRTGLRVLANRGASGIDGTIATALGVATASSAPVWALLGDLAFLHDASSLVWNARSGPPLVLVVLDNGGGGIFALLPQASLDATERTLFETPHDVDVAAVAAAAGADVEVVTQASRLSAAVLRRPTQGIRVLVVRTDRERNAAHHAELSAAVSSATRRPA